MFPPLAERLARAGFATISFNLSGSGVDDSGELVLARAIRSRHLLRGAATIVGMVMDALVRGELGLRPPTTIGLVGHSRGGGIAVLQAARDRRVQALVTWAAISSVERTSPREVMEWRKSGVKEIVNTRTGPAPASVHRHPGRRRAQRQRIARYPGRRRAARRSPGSSCTAPRTRAVPHLEAEALRAACALPDDAAALHRRGRPHLRRRPSVGPGAARYGRPCDGCST